jgi:hypothetical protein
MVSTKVEVISASRAMDVNGESLFLIQFGHMLEVSEETARTLPRPQGQAAPKLQGTNVLALYFDFKGAVPYKVGSFWNIEIKENGELSLKEAKG